MTTCAIAYYRVSTQRQGQSGLGLDAQRSAVENYARANGLIVVQEFTEVETGTNKRTRPEISKAISAADEGGCKLLIAKLDRLARNVHFISGLMESNVDFVAVDQPHANKLTVHIMAAIAEHEAKMISDRTKAALAATKARGTTLGSPQNLDDRARENSLTARREASRIKMQQATRYAIKARQTGDTLQQIADDLNDMGHTTMRGSQFRPNSVKRLLEKVAA